MKYFQLDGHHYEWLMEAVDTRNQIGESLVIYRECGSEIVVRDFRRGGIAFQWD